MTLVECETEVRSVPATLEVTRDRWRRRELSRTPFGAKFAVSPIPPPPLCLHELGGF
jgi:hypothetical protein